MELISEGRNECMSETWLGGTCVCRARVQNKLPLPANHNIANNSSAWRVSVIAAGGITVFRIYYFMSNIDNLSAAVELFNSSSLD